MKMGLLFLIPFLRDEDKALAARPNICGGEGERLLYPWHVLDTFGNGTIVDIRTGRRHHEAEYSRAEVGGEEVYIVCGAEAGGGDSAAIIFFDQTQRLVSTVLTSVSLVCLLLHILIYSSLKKLRQNEPAKEHSFST